MIQKLKCLFGFHSHSQWWTFEETAGLGSALYKKRYCMCCDHTQVRHIV